MRFIVDTNIIISALIRDSKTRFLLTHFNAELFSVGFSKIEFVKHKNEIIKKAKVNEEELDMILEKIHSRLTLIKDEMIELRIEDAKKIMSESINTKTDTMKCITANVLIDFSRPTCRVSVITRTCFITIPAKRI